MAPLFFYNLPSNMSRRALPLVFFLIYTIAPTSSYFITVDAHAEECFFDRVEAGTKMGRLYLFPP